MIAKIYKPPKSAMQSGKGTQQWLLEFEQQSRQNIEPLMGYNSCRDTKRQIRMRFPNKQSAIDYAKANGLPYKVFEPKQPQAKKISYSDNFGYNRTIAWTH